MTEHDDLLKDLFPVGEERWVKVKYLDFEKALKTFYVGPNNEKSEQLSKDLGFETRAIGIRPEYEPQISAIMDLKEDIVSRLSFILEERQIEQINQIFKLKIDESKIIVGWNKEDTKVKYENIWPVLQKILSN
jgi:hypothetical protein